MHQILKPAVDAHQWLRFRFNVIQCNPFIKVVIFKFINDFNRQIIKINVVSFLNNFMRVFKLLFYRGPVSIFVEDWEEGT